MTNDLLIYGENICAFSHILGSPSSYMTLHPIPSEFPNIWGFFFISALMRKICFLFLSVCESNNLSGNIVSKSSLIGPTIKFTWARICKPFRGPGIDSQAVGPVRSPYLTYRPARLNRPTDSILWNRFLGSLNVYKFGLWKDTDLRSISFLSCMSWRLMFLFLSLSSTETLGLADRLRLLLGPEPMLLQIINKLINIFWQFKEASRLRIYNYVKTKCGKTETRNNFYRSSVNSPWRTLEYSEEQA